jgi:hypothetical protein
LAIIFRSAIQERDPLAEANWFWAQGQQQNGPVQGSAIARLVADGKLGADDLIWKEGMAEWIPVSKVPALVKYLKTPPQAPVVKIPPAAAARQASAPVIAYQNAPVDRTGIHQFVSDPNQPVTCPHCSATNTAGSQFCEACGMALPIPNSGPRIVDHSTFATTAAGQHLQSDELHKQAKKAAGALLAVAIIQTVVTAIMVGLANVNPRVKPITANPAELGLIVIAAVFWGLYFWARKQPLPAAIVGLVLYVTLKVIDFVAAISTDSIGRGNTNGVGNTGISWLSIVIIIVLAQAISAGLKYRKMQGRAVETAV